MYLVEKKGIWETPKLNIFPNIFKIIENLLTDQEMSVYNP